jgi:transcriptional regulator with XRE-family HTH domain
MKVTGAQIRAARAFLKWSVSKLAEQSGVGISTIQKVEDVDGDPSVDSTLQWRSDARTESLTKIVTAMEKAGIKFLPSDGAWEGIRGRVDRA